MDGYTPLRRWTSLVISLAVLVVASVAGCGAVGRTTPTPAASMLAPGAQQQETAGECVRSDPKGSCGPYEDSGIGIASGSITVGQDVWNPLPGWSQTLHARSPDNWYVTVDMPAGNTSVISFPNVGDTYASNMPLSHFSGIYSSFTEEMHATRDTKAWAGYDIWLNGWKNEVLIQNDYVNHGGCGFLASAKFGGSGGVPVQPWNLCKYGKEIIWWLAGGNEQAGAVDILAILDWLVKERIFAGAIEPDRYQLWLGDMLHGR